jgi:hypothetical protein
LSWTKFKIYTLYEYDVSNTVCKPPRLSSGLSSIYIVQGIIFTVYYLLIIQLQTNIISIMCQFKVSFRLHKEWQNISYSYNVYILNNQNSCHTCSIILSFRHSRFHFTCLICLQEYIPYSKIEECTIFLHKCKEVCQW